MGFIPFILQEMTSVNNIYLSKNNTSYALPIESCVTGLGSGSSHPEQDKVLANE